MSTANDATTIKGAGLARGPAMLIGTVLSALGLAVFFKVNGTPLSTAGFPDARESGQGLLGFQVNAWTAWLTTAAGVVLLIAAAQHLVAKTVSLIVGLALGAAAVIAVIDGHDVVGLAAANALTALVWGVCAAVLLANTLAPRVRHEQDAARTDSPTSADPRSQTRREPAFADSRNGGEGSAVPAHSTSETAGTR